MLGSYWELLLLLATWSGIAALGLRRRADWKRKRFIQQVNFSLNGVREGTLLLRTLLEDSADRVWLNEYGVKQVLRAAAATTVDQPFLRLRSARDMDYVKRAVLNVLSERFSGAFLARALGARVRSARFVFGLTYERYGHIRTQKLRVIIMEEHSLDEVFGGPDGGTSLQVASESHRDRITTLKRLHALHHARKERDRRLVGTVELGVVVPASIGAAQPDDDRPSSVAPPPEAPTLHREPPASGEVAGGS